MLRVQLNRRFHFYLSIIYYISGFCFSITIYANKCMYKNWFHFQRVLQSQILTVIIISNLFLIVNSNDSTPLFFNCQLLTKVLPPPSVCVEGGWWHWGEVGGARGAGKRRWWSTGNCKPDSRSVYVTGFFFSLSF